MNIFFRTTSLILFFTLSFGQVVAQQADTTDNKINLFLDCQRCNDFYIQDEIQFVSFVRDKEDADIHLLITRQRTGSGTEFNMRFIGRKAFEGQDKTITYNSPDSDTEDEERIGMVKNIKIGLLPYVSTTDMVQNLDISYDAESQQETTPKDDPWNSWIFEVDVRSFFNGEETSKRWFVSTGLNAERVTKDWKIQNSYDYDYSRRTETFNETDSLGNRKEVERVFISRGQNFESFLIKSLNEHWSAGLFAIGNTSTRNNIDLSAAAGPGIEYNIFPYEEYNQREISISYFITPQYRNYEEITIYRELEETLLQQRLRSNIQFTQPWGQIEGRANFSAYMHDLTKNRLDINLEFDFRIFRGLSFNISGQYSFINDQLSVPKGDITDAEQLLNLRQRLTSYSFRGSVGIEYTFGSIFNSTVNPRF